MKITAIKPRPFASVRVWLLGLLLGGVVEVSILVVPFEPYFNPPAIAGPI